MSAFSATTTSIKSPCLTHYGEHVWTWDGVLTQAEPRSSERCECGRYRWDEICNLLTAPTGAAVQCHTNLRVKHT
jgi:hypothetical protein